MSSAASPIENAIDGIPSTAKLIILPVAKPVMKMTLVIVAVRQRAGLKIPLTHKAAIPKYNPIIALNTCFKSVDSTSKSNSLGNASSGNRP